MTKLIPARIPSLFSRVTTAPANLRIALLLLGLGLLAAPERALAQRPLGIDVSSYQGGSINWSSVKSSGVTFAWAKATEGTYYYDADFTINEANAQAAGVYIGAYHFARPDLDVGTAGADTEAAYFWNHAKAYLTGGNGYLVPMLDFETSYGSGASMSAWINEWCQAVKNYAAANGAVCNPVVYTDGSIASSLTSPATNWPLDIADPTCGNPQTTSPGVSLGPWGTWTFWQYCWTASVSGVGTCDQDVLNGSASTLQLFLITTSGTSAGPGVSLDWDPGAKKASPGSGGSGNWDNGTSDWWLSGTGDVAWNAGGDYADFAGTAGTVTLTTGVSADSLTFDTAGYVITGTSQTLTLNSPGNINVAPGNPTYIECILGGVGYNLSGGGILVLNNANNASGSGTSAEFIIGPGTTLVVNNQHAVGNGGVTLNLEAGGIYQDNDSTSGDQFLLPGSAIALLSGGGIFDNPDADLTMTNWITGPGSLTIIGTTYTLTLTDTANNYTGGTIVQSGTLKANAAGVMGSASGPLTVSGGTLNLNGASHTVGAVTNSGGTIQNGTLTGSSYTGEGGTVSAVLAGSGTWTQTSGTTTLSGANTYTGITTINDGLLQITNDDNLGAAPGSAVTNQLTLDNTSTGNYGLRAQSDSFSLSAKRGITLGANGGSIQVQSGQTLTVPGIITGSGGLMCGTGPTVGEGTLVLSGANTYTGATTIACGTLRLGASAALPDTSVFIATAAVGGTLDLNGYSPTIATLSAPLGTNAAGNVINNTGTLTINGASVLNSGQSGSSAYSGVISGSGKVAVTGGGSHTLSGANTYGGTTTVSGGTLVPSLSGALPSASAVTVNSPGIFDIVSVNETIPSLAGSGTVNLGSGTLTVNGSSSTTFSGVIQGSPAEAYVANSTSQPGLWGYYYNANNPGFTGTPVMRLDTTVNFSDLTTQQPAGINSTEFTARWIGRLLTTSSAGTYTFWTTSDDGTRLWVNGQLVVNNWAYQPATARTNTISLSANTYYDIRLEYEQGAGGASCVLSWMPPGGTSAVIPSSNLSTYAGYGGLVKSGSSTLTLGGANTYQGATSVSAGTLALGAGGSLGASAVTVASGATLANATTTTRTIGGATTLNSGAYAAFTGAGGASSAVGQISVTGNLTLNANALTVNVTGSALAAGSYRLLDCTGTLTGSANTTPTITGTALATGYTAAVSTTAGASGHVDLIVKATPAFSGLTASPSITYGATSVTLSGAVSSTTGPTTVYAANGDTVTATIGGHAVNGTVSGSVGAFSITYNDPSLKTEAYGTYPITYAYAGNSAVYLNAAANNTSTSLTVNKAALGITANNDSKTYGQAKTYGAGSTAFTSTGLQNSETIGSVTITASGGTAATAAVGSYNLTPSAAMGGTFTAGNYSLTYNNGTLTVNPLAVQLSGTRAYDGTTNADAAILSVANPVDGDTVNVASGSAGLAGADAGSEAITSLGALALGNNAAGDYTLSGASGSVTITNASTTNSVAASPNPSLPGANVIFTATLGAVPPGAGTPTGSVRFKTNGIALCDAIALDGSGVATLITNSLPHGSNTVTAEFTGNANLLGNTNFLGATNSVVQIVNTPPLASGTNAATVQNQALVLSDALLLSLASDPDGDSLSLVSAGPTSTNGGAVTLAGGNVTYQPLPGFIGADLFSFVVSDPYGASATGAVLVAVSAASVPPPTIVGSPSYNSGSGTFSAAFVGVPNCTYTIQWASVITGPWSFLSTVTADTNGLFQVTDTQASPPPARYYRAVYSSP